MNGWRKRRQAAELFTAMFLMAVVTVRANNLQLSRVDVLALNSYPQSDTNALVEFDISWDNSWRFNTVNHDAAWVFFKAQTEADGPWQHVKLIGAGINPTHYVTGSGDQMEIIVPDDGVGLLIRRAEEGAGSVAATGVRAVWDFSALGLENTDTVTLQAFGVEMVYVPEGSFWVGSGGKWAKATSGNEGYNNEPGSFTDGAWTDASTTTFPFRVTSEAALQMGKSAGMLWGTSEGLEGTDHETIGDMASDGSYYLPAGFPKGYAAFYCMKYEVTQGQYRDFLNTLTRAQQVNRVRSTSANQYVMSNNVDRKGRNGLRAPATIPAEPEPIVFGCDFNGNGTFDEEGDGVDLACNFLSARDAGAIAHWMGLRPMTELEYEKAARGADAPIPGDLAWGGDVSTMVRSIVSIHDSNDGKPNMTFSTGNINAANAWNNDTRDGPVRAGIWATETSTRQEAGASYWGIMELSGNVQEFIMSVGLAGARDNFTGVHGNGELTAAGHHNVTGWPYNNGGYTGGWGRRGGDWFRGATWHNWDNSRPFISNRAWASHRSDGGTETTGFRAVRTAPAID